MNRPKIKAGEIVQHKLTKQRMIALEDIFSYEDGGDFRWKDKNGYQREYFFASEVEKTKGTK